MRELLRNFITQAAHALLPVCPALCLTMKKELSMFKIETKRLIIRDMTPSDESAFVAMSQDANCLLYTSDAADDP